MDIDAVRRQGYARAQPEWGWGTQGGLSGFYIVDEMIGGSCAMMSSCYLSDARGKIWARFQDGDSEGICDVLPQTLPIQGFSDSAALEVWKGDRGK